VRAGRGELTYGLERLAMYIQGVENVYDLDFNGAAPPTATCSCRPSGKLGLQLRASPTPPMLFRHFADAEPSARAARAGLVLPAYDQCIKASHRFNLLDARGRDQRDRARRLHRPRPGAGAGPTC
jgi:glycyl-tRNA synthetase alpha chain